MMKSNPIRFAFFGTPVIAVAALDALLAHGYIPTVIVTSPDRPQGRGMHVAASAVKQWAEKNSVPVLQPETLDAVFKKELASYDLDLGIVVAYGAIIPASILSIPRRGILNVHPSLLPKYRGASPIESAILAGDSDTAVSLMLMDEKMDHGPVLKTEPLNIENKKASQVKQEAGTIGGGMLALIMPEWITERVEAVPQNHAKATFTKKIKKEDGLIDPVGSPELALRKIRAFDEWPGAYFFVEKNGKKMRVVVKDATLREGALVITRAVPEGKKEMNEREFSDWNK